LFLSTLTKALIVLLTLASIFLCGIVVTYVARANNYKQKYDDQVKDLQAAKQLYQTKISTASEDVARAQQQLDEANQKITELEAQKSKIQIDLATAERSSYGCQERLTNLAGVVSGLNQTISSMDQSLKLTREELDKARTEQVKNRKELNEVTAALNEKSVQADSLESERRRLLEENSALEQQLAGAGKSGKMPSVQPVTPAPAGVRSAPPVTNQVSLTGKITEINLKNNLVTVSLGSADGVRTGMRFHVVRGDTFVCDIVITNVDVDRSAGTLQLIRQQPQVGDTVSTNL
jgi:flagellar biosynthesis chaperone FliJ